MLGTNGHNESEVAAKRDSTVVINHCPTKNILEIGVCFQENPFRSHNYGYTDKCGRFNKSALK